MAKIHKAYRDKRGVLSNRKTDYTMITTEGGGDEVDVMVDGAMLLRLFGKSDLRAVLEAQPATQLVTRVEDQVQPVMGLVPSAIPDEAQHPGAPQSVSEAVAEVIASGTVPNVAAAANVDAPTDQESVLDWAARVLSPSGLSLGDAISSGAVKAMIDRQDGSGSGWRNTLGDGWKALLSEISPLPMDANPASTEEEKDAETT